MGMSICALTIWENPVDAGERAGRPAGGRVWGGIASEAMGSSLSKVFSAERRGGRLTIPDISFATARGSVRQLLTASVAPNKRKSGQGEDPHNVSPSGSTDFNGDVGGQGPESDIGPEVEGRGIARGP